MKLKQLAKRLRSRSDEFHRMAMTFEHGDKAVAERARMLGDVLQEVADQVCRPSKKKKFKKVKKSKGKKLLPTNGESIHT
jgi:hypothetical protein